jgi:hypothetical protein
MTNRRSSPHVVSYTLAAVAIVVGLWLLRGSSGPAFDLTEFFARFDPRGRPVMLTGLDRRGQLEVPVINLWAQPGFGRDNVVAAQVRLGADGAIDARLVDEIELDGLSWKQVHVGDARGWVVSRFVAE